MSVEVRRMGGRKEKTSKNPNILFHQLSKTWPMDCVHLLHDGFGGFQQLFRSCLALCSHPLKRESKRTRAQKCLSVHRQLLTQAPSLRRRQAPIALLHHRYQPQLHCATTTESTQPRFSVMSRLGHQVLMSPRDQGAPHWWCLRMRGLQFQRTIK